MGIPPALIVLCLPTVFEGNEKALLGHWFDWRHRLSPTVYNQLAYAIEVSTWSGTQRRESRRPTAKSPNRLIRSITCVRSFIVGLGCLILYIA